MWYYIIRMTSYVLKNKLEEKKLKPQCSVTSLLNRNFLLLMLCSTLSAVAFQMVIPTLPKYAVSLGISLSQAGILSGMFSLTALVVRPFSGALADRLNQKYLILFATFLMASGTFGLSISSSLPMLMLFRIIQGIGFAINGTTCIALATNFMPPEQISQGIGYFTMSNLIATTFGPTLGLSLSELFGYTAVFRVAALSPLAAALFVLTVSNKKETSTRRSSGIHLQDLFAPQLAPFLLFTGVFSFSNGIVNSFLALWSEEQGISGYSAFFIIQSVAIFLVRPQAGRINDKKGLSYVLLPAYLFAAFTLILIGTASNRWILYIAALFGAFGVGVGSPACQAECVKRLGPEQRGVAVSTYYIGADVAQGIAPAVGGAVAEQLGYSVMYCGASLLFGIAALIYFFYHRSEAISMAHS